MTGRSDACFLSASAADLPSALATTTELGYDEAVDGAYTPREGSFPTMSTVFPARALTTAEALSEQEQENERVAPLHNFLRKVPRMPFPTGRIVSVVNSGAVGHARGYRRSVRGKEGRPEVVSRLVHTKVTADESILQHVPPSVDERLIIAFSCPDFDLPVLKSKMTHITAVERRQLIWTSLRARVKQTSWSDCDDSYDGYGNDNIYPIRPHQECHNCTERWCCDYYGRV